MGIKLKALTKSPWVYHLSTGSCNNCDIEILDCLTPKYDHVGTHREGSGGLWEHMGHQGIDSEQLQVKIREMVYMACYDLDRFRRFVLESTFLDRFEVAPATAEAVKTDDLALFGLALQWLEYGLLARHVLEVRPGIMAAKKQQMGIE